MINEVLSLTCLIVPLLIFTLVVVFIHNRNEDRRLEKLQREREHRELILALSQKGRN